MTDRMIVVDTNLLYATPQVFALPEFESGGSNTFVIPAAVLWELDVLCSRPQQRGRARAAMNTLKEFIDRGATREAVSCGVNKRIRVAAAAELQTHAQLDLSLADDRILATALSCQGQSAEVAVATTDFALYAKALSLGLAGFYLDQYPDALMTTTRRERVDFANRWRRVQSATNIASLCRRAVSFLSCAVCRGVWQATPQDLRPATVNEELSKWLGLSDQWVTGVQLPAIFKGIFNLDYPKAPDYTVKRLQVPGTAIRTVGVKWQDTIPTDRAESDAERALRIQREKEIYEQVIEFCMDEIFRGLDVIYEFILDQVEEDLLD